MDKLEFDIRISEIKELTSENKFHRWEILRYNGYPIKVSMSASVLPDINRNILALTMGVRYVSSRDYSEKELLRYNILVDFEIDNLEKQIQITEKAVKIPSHLLTLIISVGVGTLRGMLAQRTAGTVFDKYPLPLMNISEIVSAIMYSERSRNPAYPLFKFVYD